MIDVEQFKEAARILDKHALTLDEISSLWNDAMTRPCRVAKWLKRESESA
jgi:hypothetical protein